MKNNIDTEIENGICAIILIFTVLALLVLAVRYVFILPLL